jgi:hypothetical protein
MNSVSPPTMPGSFANPTAPVSNQAVTPTTVTNPTNTFPDPHQGGGGGVGVGVGVGIGGMPTAPVYQLPVTMPGGTAQTGAPIVGGQHYRKQGKECRAEAYILTLID